MTFFGDTTLLLEGGICLLAGAALCFWFLNWRNRTKKTSAEAECGAMIDNARREAETLKREARLSLQEDLFKERAAQEETLAARRREIADTEDRLVRRETSLAQQLENLARKESELAGLQTSMQQQEASLATRQKELDDLSRQRREGLEKLSQLDAAAAREELLAQVRQEAADDANRLYRVAVEEAKSRADEKARHIVSTAIQRYAGNQTFDSTTAAITLPGEEIKGRIIGREGRNIRAFEHATGVTVLIDDTPNAVVLSGFDPVRREIAREAMQRLIQDGRIHPTRIEEVVAKVSQEMSEAILRHGEEAVQRANVAGLHPEIVKLLGRLRYRHSYSQNILEHSIEVAHLAGLMASELGVDPAAARRSGLLHDIGKAVDHEMEGAHAIVGAEILKRHGESELIVSAVAGHHGEVPTDGPISALLSAADAISASRPGARSETMTTYLKRVEDLERIGLSFSGVEKCFAVQAGRELRVLVRPEKTTDDQALGLARDIARKIEEELQYPGQIRVVVMRETRCVELAK